MCHSCHGTTRRNGTEAFGCRGTLKDWKVVESLLSRPLQSFCFCRGCSSSVGIAASSARVVSRCSSIQAIACGLSKVVLLVLVTRPVMTTCWPGFGVAGANESMVNSTTGSSARGSATAAGRG